MTDDIHWLIGENSEKARRAARLSPRELALKAGLPIDRTAQIEAGLVSATVEEIYALKMALEINIEDLYRRG